MEFESYRNIAAQVGGPNYKPLLFAHGVEEVYGIGAIIEKVPGAKKYAARALPMGTKDDIIAVQDAPDESYVDYLRNTANIGHSSILVTGTQDTFAEYFKKGRKIGTFRVDPSSEVSATDLAQIVATGSHYYAPYMGRQREKEVEYHTNMRVFASETDDIVKRFYQKDSFKKECRESGLAVIEPDKVLQNPQSYSRDQLRSYLLDAIKEFGGEAGKVFYRERGLASGVGNGSINLNAKKGAQSHIETVLNYFAKTQSSETYLIEPHMQFKTSPSSIGVIDTNGEAHVLGTSNQILSGAARVHQGNRFNFTDNNPNRDLYAPTQKIADRMAQSGFVGAFGIDFIKGDKGLLLPIESNARVTGAFPAYEIRARLAENGHEFNYSTLTSKTGLGQTFDSFAEFAHVYNELLYTQGAQSGIIPINPHLLQEKGEKDGKNWNGKTQYVVVADSHEETKRIISRFNELSSPQKKPPGTGNTRKRLLVA